MKKVQKYSLIGLSLSACLNDVLIKKIISIELIHHIFSGTAIKPFEIESIEEWFDCEKLVNRNWNNYKSKFIETILQLMKNNQLIQPRYLNNNMKPCYRATYKWIHINKWIDWNRFNLINQSCPFCGSINEYNEVYHHILTQKRISKKYKLLSCNSCFNEWKIPFNHNWFNKSDNYWITP